MLPRTRSLLLLALAFWAGDRSAHAQAADRAQKCQLCDPASIIAEARDSVDRTMAWYLPAGDAAAPPVAPFVLRAAEDAELGLLSGSLPFARQAAARCLLSQDEPGCGDALLLLGEAASAAGAGDAEQEREALAFLALVPWENVSRSRCVSGMVLRYRLSEQLTPRRAEPEWADRCGPLGQGGELGYRAAKAALLRADLVETERRLESLSRAGTPYVVRAQYLRAVLRVAEGRLDAAARELTRVLELPIEGRRPPAEDDARMLAALQLARLAREAGDRELAQDYYSAVPPYSLGREDALLEGAVVAGQRGDFARTRLYLEALAAYRPQIRQQLAVYRLRANVAVVDGEEDVARATFKELSQIGRDVRARMLGGGDVAVVTRLREDPSLGGLLDPEQARELVAIEDGLRWLASEVDVEEQRVALLRNALASGTFAADLDAAIERLEAASALLAQAEQVVGAAARGQSVWIAGPAETALQVARDAAALRTEIDGTLRDVRDARGRRGAKIAARVAEVEQELAATRAQLQALDPVAREDLRALTALLVGHARDVAEDLELSEEVGEMELSWRAKQRSTLEVTRARKEYDESLIDLATSGDQGQGGE